MLAVIPKEKICAWYKNQKKGAKIKIEKGPGMLLTRGWRNRVKSLRVGLSQGIDLDPRKKFHCSFEENFSPFSFAAHPIQLLFKREREGVLSNVSHSAFEKSWFNLILCHLWEWVKRTVRPCGPHPE